MIFPIFLPHGRCEHSRTLLFCSRIFFLLLFFFFARLCMYKALLLVAKRKPHIHTTYNIHTASNESFHWVNVTECICFTYIHDHDYECTLKWFFFEQLFEKETPLTTQTIYMIFYLQCIHSCVFVTLNVFCRIYINIGSISCKLFIRNFYHILVEIEAKT